MKYATEVINLLAAYPGRRFRTRQILNHVVPRGTPRARSAAKVGVARVLASLILEGQVAVAPPARSGSFAEYWWKSGTCSSGKAIQKPAQFGRDSCVL